MLVDGSAPNRLGCAIEHELLPSEPENLKGKSATKESRSGQRYSFLPSTATRVPSSLGCGSSTGASTLFPRNSRRQSSSIAAVPGHSATGALAQGAVQGRGVEDLWCLAWDHGEVAAIGGATAPRCFFWCRCRGDSLFLVEMLHLVLGRSHIWALSAELKYMQAAPGAFTCALESIVTCAATYPPFNFHAPWIRAGTHGIFSPNKAMMLPFRLCPCYVKNWENLLLVSCHPM
jgi:hypothetical protein